MRFSTTIVALWAASLLLLFMGSGDVSADAEDDDEAEPCWGGYEWNDIWWGVGMMVMMSGGILVLLLAGIFLMKDDSFHLSNILHNNSIRGRGKMQQGSFHHQPSPMNNRSSQLDILYARGEISREEYINSTINDFINRFSEEE